MANRILQIALISCAILSCSSVTSDAAKLSAIQPGSLEDAADRIHNGDLDAAIAILQRIIKKADANSVAHFYLGDAFADQEKYAQAAPEYQKAIELGTKEKNRSLLNQIYRNRARMETIEKHYPQAVEDYKKSIANATSQTKDVAGILRELAHVYKKMARWQDAIYTYTKAINASAYLLEHDKVTKMGITRIRSDKTKLLFERAEAYRAIGKTADAARDEAEAEKMSDQL